MYEDLKFGDVRKATRESGNNGLENLDVEIERETTASKEKLILTGVGAGPLIDVYLDLVTGELETDNARRTNPDYDVESVDTSVSGDEMEIEIDRVGETIELVVECEGEVNDNTGPDLEEFGMDI